MTVLTIFSAILFITLAVIVFVSCAPQFGAGSAKKSMRFIQSPNYIKGKFVNMLPTPMMAEDVSYWDLFKQQVKGVENSVPGYVLPNIKETDLKSSTNQGLQITWLGHSTVLIQLNGKTILTDPVLTERASPLSFMGPKAFEGATPYDVYDLPVIDLVIISHDHYDHLDYKTIKKIHFGVKQFYTPLGVGAHLEKWGVDQSKIKEFDWWEESKFDSTLKIVATPARHFSGRGIADRNSTLWASWVIKGDSGSVFFGGDSGYASHFSDIGNKYGPFDITLLETGQYNKNWPYIHSMPEETAEAHADLKGNYLLPIHWGKFVLALHSWTEPVERLKKQTDSLNIKLLIPRIGDRFIVGKDAVVSDWW